MEWMLVQKVGGGIKGMEGPFVCGFRREKERESVLFVS